MKRLIATILATVIMFAVSSAFAQGLTGGAKIGFNMADLSGNDAEEWNAKMGFCVGGFATYSFLDIVAIQPELLFTMKGAEHSAMFDTGGPIIEVRSSMNLNYLEIPVLAKLTLPTGIVKPTLLIGPALSIKMSSKVKVEVNGESEEEDIENVKGTDFGLVFGAGADFDIMIGKVTIDARYILGLTTLSDAWLNEKGDPADIKNGVISIMLGYSYSF